LYDCYAPYEQKLRVDGSQKLCLVGIKWKFLSNTKISKIGDDNKPKCDQSDQSDRFSESLHERKLSQEFDEKQSKGHIGHRMGENVSPVPENHTPKSDSPPEIKKATSISTGDLYRKTPESPSEVVVGKNISFGSFDHLIQIMETCKEADANYIDSHFDPKIIKKALDEGFMMELPRGTYRFHS